MVEQQQKIQEKYESWCKELHDIITECSGEKKEKNEVTRNSIKNNKEKDESCKKNKRIRINWQI